METLKRYLIFLVGLFVNSLGVSLITKANLGTSPISSIPYVLSLNFPFTLGNFTIFFSIFLIVLQLIILRKNFKLEHILQIPVSIIFGYFIDLTMILFSWVNPEAYIMKIVYLLIGCLILGVGVYMEVSGRFILDIGSCCLFFYFVLVFCRYAFRENHIFQECKFLTDESGDMIFMMRRLFR